MELRCFSEARKLADGDTEELCRNGAEVSVSPEGQRLLAHYSRPDKGTF